MIRPASSLLPGWVFWTAKVTAAVVFGAGHLPAMAALLSLTTLVIVQTVALNALVGPCAGVLFRRRGIEAAILCHFAADIVLHVGAPFVQTLSG